MGYVPALDGLRALAVMLVFLFHRGRYFPGGWIGVDIFFVLSGYLITSILAGEHEATGTISLPRFYLRRTCRLLPALVAVVCVAVALAVRFDNDRPGTEMDAAAALLYVADYRYAPGSAGEPTSLTHTWSLSVEEQFYLFWPVLLFALLRWNRRAALWATMAAIVVVGARRGFLLLHSADPFPRTYFAFDARSDEMLIGCALALWQPQISGLRFARHLWPGVLVLLAVVVLEFGPEEWLRRTNVAGYPLIGVAAAYLIVIAVGDKKNYLTYFLSIPVVVAFGRISYGFYLWHFVIIREQENLAINHFWMTFAVSLAAATASYLIIERPFLRLGRLGFAFLRPPAAGSRRLQAADERIEPSSAT